MTPSAAKPLLIVNAIASLLALGPGIGVWFLVRGGGPEIEEGEVLGALAIVAALAGLSLPAAAVAAPAGSWTASARSHARVVQSMISLSRGQVAAIVVAGLSYVALTA